MNTFDEMWKRLKAHQPRADKRGYGKEWKRMCTERTPQAAEAASDAAWAAGDAAAWAASWTAMVTANASTTWPNAIKNINKAEEPKP